MDDGLLNRFLNHLFLRSNHQPATASSRKSTTPAMAPPIAAPLFFFGGGLKISPKRLPSGSSSPDRVAVVLAEDAGVVVAL